MKLIIECTEQTYSECKKISGLSETAYVIAHGTPYNPTGDLISREALKEAIEEVEDNYDGYEPNDLGKFMSKVYDLIDNAQTVDLWQMRQEATENALKKAEALYGRTKGEWEVVHTATGEVKCKCNQCQHYIKIGDDKNFCPNCGADMRKGGAE